jgi:CRISPR-associated endonuclease/helicase Cas3
MEFIKKSTARKIYRAVQKALPEKRIVELTGDDNILNRNKILDELNEKDENDHFVCTDIIVVATQVIEAGVDLDMDIGMKDISMLDNEEQFLGRINRSCARAGCRAYFFDLDDAESVYKSDVRLEGNLYDKKYREYLQNKNFEEFYGLCFKRIDDKKNEYNANNIGDMINEAVALNFRGIEKRMRLIDSKQCRIFLAHEILTDEDERIDGLEVWEAYKSLVFDENMEYARKMVELSCIYQKMSYFLYNYSSLPGKGKYDTGIKPPPIYDESIGDIFLVKNGQAYITEDGKFDREKYGEESESDFV